MFFKKSKPPLPSPEKQTLTAFANRFEGAKRNLAAFLQMKSDLVSLHTKKKVVIIAALVIACMCVASLRVAWRTPSYVDELNVGSLIIPKIVIPDQTGDTVLSKDEYRQIMKLKNAIDSLHQHRSEFSDTVRK